MKREGSKLLELLNSRAAWDQPKALPPVLDAGYQRRISMALQCIKEVDTSDPWAVQRARLYMERGYEIPSDVLDDCKGRRRVTPGPFQALEPIKRKMDADRAWNQHRSAQYRRES